MRSPIIATAVAAFGLFVSSAGHASEEARKTLNTQLPYPAAVSLVHDRMGWTFRQSAASLPLYLYEPHEPVKSACSGACEAQWIPLLASAGEKPLGDWTIIVRKDGRRQWAFEQHPVYTHLHDTPDRVSGDGADGVWHLMPHFRS